MVSILDELAALKPTSTTTQAELDLGFDKFYASLLQNSAVAGLALQVHWDTVNPNPPGASDSYFWNYVQGAFNQADIWNRRHPADPPKTIQLIVMPDSNRRHGFSRRFPVAMGCSCLRLR